MREILCRGKRLDNGVWEYGDLIENQGRFFIYHATSETTIEDNDDGRIVVAAVEVDLPTVGQYTGLKDKNGKKIYEADILTVTFRNMGVVEWRDGGFVVNFGDMGMFELTHCFGYTYQMCITGNIHDNADLIKIDDNEKDDV